MFLNMSCVKPSVREKNLSNNKFVLLVCLKFDLFHRIPNILNCLGHCKYNGAKRDYDVIILMHQVLKRKREREL